MIIYYDNGAHPLLRDQFRESGVSFTPLYKSAPAQWLDRLTRHLCYPRSLVLSSPPCPAGEDTVIVFDSYADSGYMKWLCRQYPDQRIILWFWNPVKDREMVELMPRRAELWSYSKKDCARWGLRYNTSFYFDSAARLAAQAEPAPARERPLALFIGREKGRERALQELKTLLEESGARTGFHLIRNHERKDRTPGREPLMSYPEILDQVRQADVLVDYSRDPEAGLSLRVMEALFWQKKLVTNSTVIRDCDFYDPANVYLAGQESRSLAEFLRTPLRPVDPAVRDRYLLSRWLERFEEKGN